MVCKRIAPRGFHATVLKVWIAAGCIPCSWSQDGQAYEPSDRQPAITAHQATFTQLPATETTDAGHSNRLQQGIHVAKVEMPCVLLRNDSVIFGQAQQVGEFVIVRRGSGSEIRLNRRDVACWAGSVADLYRFRVDHRSSDGMAAHLAEAEWCLKYDLVEQAKRELAIASMRVPSELLVEDSQIARSRFESLGERIARAEQAFNRAPAASFVFDHKEGTSVSATAASVLFSEESEGEESEGEESEGRESEGEGSKDSGPNGERHRHLNSSSASRQLVSSFARSVQPILLNRCGSCHQNGSKQVWQLDVPLGGIRASAETTIQNLIVTLPFIDSRSPQQSDLLVKATTDHGGVTAILGPRHQKAVEALAKWLMIASEHSITQENVDQSQRTPHSTGENQFSRSKDDGYGFLDLASSNEQSLASLRWYEPDADAGDASDPLESFDLDRLKHRSQEVFRKDQSTPKEVSDEKTGTGPARMPVISNPFDPEIFNRLYHSR